MPGHDRVSIMAWLGIPFWLSSRGGGGAPNPDATPIHVRPVPANVSASRRRSAGAFVAMCLGVWLAREGLGPGAAWSLGAAVACAAIAFALQGWWLRGVLTLAVTLFAMGWYSLRVEHVDRDSLSRVVSTGAVTESIGTGRPARAMVCVEGMVLDAPEQIESGGLGLEGFLRRGSRTSFSLDVRRLAGESHLVPASGALRVWIDGEAPAGVRAGDAVRVTGVFARAGPPQNPGAVDRRLASAQDGVEGSLSMPSASLVVPVESPAWWNGWDTARSGLARVRATLNQRAGAAVDAMLEGGTEDSSALVRGLLLGRLGKEGEGLQATFTRLGLLHALTISGFHLAVMALVTLTLVRLTGDRGWLEPTIVAALVLGYSMIVPPNSPVLRSALMVLLLLASEACGRRYDRLTILFWIGVVVVLVRPLDLWSLGFQLTFGLTALLYAVVPVFESRVVGPQVFGTKPGTVGAGQRLGRVVRGAVAINFSCWLAAAPAILFRTGLASPIAVLAGVIVGPLVVVVLWCGYVALLLGMIEPRIAGWLGVLVRPTARWTTEVAVWLDRVPWGSMRLPPVSWAWAAVTTAVLIVWLRQGWWRRSRGWLITGMLGVWLAIEWSGTGMRASVGTRIDMLGVGDGSCLLVRSGRDAILWDAGSLTAGLGAREIPTALRRLGAWRVPTVVITHPDLDHYGLLPDLIGPLGVENVVLGQRFLDRATGAESGPEAYLLNELSRRGVRVDIAGGGARLALGSREVVFLSPRAGAPYGRDNEHSLVAKVVARGSGDIALADAVLTGDVSSEAVGDLLRSHPTLGARVMELPHHGSADSRAIEWVGRVSPWVVLQSTGPTRVDDPRWAIVRSGREWHCTAVEGAVWAEVGVDGSVRAGGMERGKESGVESPATARDRSR